MSEHHAEHGAHNSHHISPASLYWAVWGGLMVLTVITVLAYYIPLWLKIDLGAANVIIAMVIATTKASLVVLFFMGLKYDKRFLAIAFLSSLIFLGLFLGFTLLDINTREDQLPFAKPVYVPKEVPLQGGHAAGAATETTPATTAPAASPAASPAAGAGEAKKEEAKPAAPAASASPAGGAKH
ncbi:MAG TPA: cytochrome C oxidase subunit IV family protein [Blastocatellia bacterium]|nr:cytochrome C oxidase subunit IV family protein [Blastocatellia bacterium]